VPQSYGQGFTSLISLSLAGNDLSGDFPAFLANVSTLEELLLAYNTFAASPLPDDIAAGVGGMTPGRVKRLESYKE
jgi:hypothetical protein